ncbi:MAG: hypothetical protein EPO68_09020 [Planctomycetota bacterium]|nr:MAG: hypothetical protein EPO68_09020 [Planctomycetota bacterium]
MLLRSRSLSLGLLALASSAAAQGQVWVVDDQPGPGVDFTSIQAGINATADGDVVLVKAGSYNEHPQITGRALTLIADLGADVRVQWGAGVFGNHSGQPVVVRGLHVPGNSQAYTTGLGIGNASGPVWVEECVLRGSHVQFAGPGTGVIITNSFGGVTIARCDILGGSGTGKASPGNGGNGVFSEGPVHVFDSIVRGGDAPPITSFPFFGQTGSGGAAVTLFNGKLFGSGASFTGGAGTNGYAHPTFGCVGGGSGGAGLSSFGAGVSVVLLDSPVQGGSGGAAFGACGLGANGPQFSPGLTPTTLNGIAHGLQVLSPVREGQPISATLHGAAGEQALFALSTTPSLGVVSQPLAGVLLLAPPVSVLGLGPVPPSGTLSVSATAGLLPPGIEGGTLFLEPAFVDPSGPSVVLGAPSTLTLLKTGL